MASNRERRRPLVTASASSGKSLNNDQLTSTPARRSKAPRPTQHFSITDGCDALGVIDFVDGRYIAINVDGEIIGDFSTLKAAATSFDGGRR